MKIKHSKYKNTGLLYELLVKQITSDLVARKDSPAVNILRKYFSGNNALVQEHSLYRTVLEGTNLTTVKADNLIAASLKAAHRINQKELQTQKYNLVSEIRDNYKLENFFSITVPEYKALAAFYCLLEADRSQDVIDPQFVVNNKLTLLERMTGRYSNRQEIEDNLLQELNSQDKDLRLLTFKILLEKFNQKYADFLPGQKNILQHIVTINSPREFREFLNEEMLQIRNQLQEKMSKLGGIEKIKLREAMKLLEAISPTEKVSDEKLVKVLQFYDLIEEIKKI